jgi:predicted metal-dependent HD superfamily phosphohydrolase
MLKEIFVELLHRYSYMKDTNLFNSYWEEIEENYSHKKRHYHTLTHLENLINQLNEVKSEIKHWDTILFSVFYHDAIYDVLSKENEENSAKLAEKRMLYIITPFSIMTDCIKQILATKNHTLSDDSDCNFLLDADLSILGSNWESYLEYSKQVRKEYSIYPNFIYNSGRKKVLNHFLGMERIFKTDYFYHKFEENAKENLARELKMY